MPWLPDGRYQGEWGWSDTNVVLPKTECCSFAVIRQITEGDMLHACETGPVYTIVEDEWENDVRIKVNSCRAEIWALTNEGEPWALIPGS